jgi:hypothetical protein
MFNGVILKKNKEKFLHDGYLYVKDRLSNDFEKPFWRCDKRWTSDCKGRIHTTYGEESVFLRMVTEHSLFWSG